MNIPVKAFKPGPSLKPVFKLILEEYAQEHGMTPAMAAALLLSKSLNEYKRRKEEKI